MQTQIELANRLSMQRGLNMLCTHACLRLPLSETLRHYFSSASFLLAIDFHKQVSNNLDSGSHAVAAALLRPIWECGITAAWFLYRADEDRLSRINANPLDLEHLAIDDADVPMTKPMLKELKELPYLEEYARNQQALIAPGGFGKFFHKYTHPTVFQLKRTFVTSDRPTRFSDSEMMGIVVLADILLLSCAAVFQAQTGDPDFNLIIKDRYDDVLARLPNTDGTLPPWSPLPKPQGDPDWHRSSA